MITFSKMHSLGNDFVLINCINKNNGIKNPSEFSKSISNRHFGIGADGLILIENSSIADFKMRIFNSDGSEAEMCGNGIRCVGKYIFDKRLSSKTLLKIETISGIKNLILTVKNNRVFYVSASIGTATIYDSINLKILNRTFNIFPVNIGNPHAVIFFNNINDINFTQYAPLIENHAFFKNKTNVEFAQIINKTLIKVLVWERGAGKTLACGTGAAAVSAVAYSQKLTSNSTKIILPGGILQTLIDDYLNVSILGPVKITYDGFFYN